MLVQILGNGAKGSQVMGQVGSMNRGFEVTGNTDVSHWSDQIKNLMNLNRSPAENDVQRAATAAGQSSVAKVLFQDYTNYRLETMTNVAAMWTTEMNARASMARTSMQVASSQDRMVQSFAQSAYQIGKGAAYTQGVANAYAQGLQASSSIM